MDRQREAGKSHKEAMRCLKRHLSNVVDRHLVGDARRAELALDNIEGLVKRMIAVSNPSRT